MKILPFLPKSIFYINYSLQQYEKKRLEEIDKVEISG